MFPCRNGVSLSWACVCPVVNRDRDGSLSPRVRLRYLFPRFCRTIMPFISSEDHLCRLYSTNLVSVGRKVNGTYHSANDAGPTPVDTPILELFSLLATHRKSPGPQVGSWEAVTVVVMFPVFVYMFRPVGEPCQFANRPIFANHAKMDVTFLQYVCPVCNIFAQLRKGGRFATRQFLRSTKTN